MANFQQLLQSTINQIARDNFGVRPKGKSEGLRFPISNQNDYGGVISFTARTPDYKTLGDRSLELFDVLIPEEDLADNLTPVQRNFSGGRTQEEIDAGAGISPNIQQQIAAAKKNKVDNVETSNTRQSADDRGRKCVLYLPGAIQIQDKVSYNNNMDLGVIGAAVREGIITGQSTGEVMAAAGQQISETFGSLVESLRSGVVSETAQIAAMRAFGANSAVSGAVSTATGVALNPNRRSMLSGPEIRTFGFTFKMIPTSRAESVAVKKIIRFFREEMYPEAIEDFGISAAFRYPAIFDIKMRYRKSDGTLKQVGTGLLPSFLQAVDVNYNQSGMAFHDDGEPQEVTLTLNFTEERTLNKSDIKTGVL